MKLKIGDILVWVIGAGGSIISGLFGGWSNGLTVLCIFMLIDFISGFAAATLGESHKSPNGGVSSKVIWVGIIKKLMTLVMCVVAAQLDKLTGFNYIRDCCVIAYIITELISIIENAGLIGIPVPAIFKKVIDILKTNNEKSVNSLTPTNDSKNDQVEIVDDISNDSDNQSNDD